MAQDILGGLIEALNKDTDLPVMLQAIGVAFLTILIPVAIAIFERTEYAARRPRVFLEIYRNAKISMRLLPNHKPIITH
jgi:hypothetical protein